MSTRRPTTTSTPSAATDTPAPAPATAAEASCYQQLRAHLAALKLADAAEHLPAVLDAAAAEGLTVTAALERLLAIEVDATAARKLAARLRFACLPTPATLADFDYDAQPGVDPHLIADLATCRYLHTATNILMIGPPGTGKTHLLIGLGTAAAEAGHRVRYVLASRLVNELAEADNDRQLSKVIARYGRIDLLCLDELGYLCLDELGYLSLDRRGAELLFQVLTEREERASVAVATNEPFSAWPNTFTDPRLCAALLDRLLHRSVVLDIGGDSYRLRDHHARTHTLRAAAATHG